MKNLKRIKYIFVNLHKKDYLSFIADLLKSYFLHGNDGLKYELDEWEETIEIKSNETIMSNIHRIKKHLAN